jgi:hypothetical protein
MSIVALVHSTPRLPDAVARLGARQIAWLVFLVTLLIYWSLVPWVSSHWWLSGDEPHYLVVTHSLLTDRDLDLANNYEEKDFTLFYVGSELDPHIAIGPDGGAYPAHTAGLSVVLLPGYALGYFVFGSHAGVLYFLTLMGALLAANVYLLCYEVTDRKFSSLLAWVTTAFTVPVMHYSFQVYPELLGALLLVWSLRHIRRAGRTRFHVWLVVGLCVGVMPWLSSRFIPLSVFLAAAAFYAILTGVGTSRWRGWAIAASSAPAMLSCALLLAFNVGLYGKIAPRVGPADTGTFVTDFARLPSLQQLATGAGASLFDQDAGLLIYAPVYLLTLAGILLLFGRSRRDALLILIPLATMYLAVVRLGHVLGGWGVPCRYLVVVLPLAAVCVAYGLQQVTSAVYRGVGAAFLVVSIVTSLLVMHDPLLARAYESHGGPGLALAYGRLFALPLADWLPSFRWGVTALYAHEVGPAEVGTLVRDSQAKGIHDGIPSVESVAMADSATEGQGTILTAAWPADDQASLAPARSYSACVRLKCGNDVPSERVVAVIEVSADDAILARRETTKADLPVSEYGLSCLQFDYPGGVPLGFRVLFTDETDLWVDWIALSYADDPSRKWFLAGLWWVALLAFTGYYYARWRHEPEGVADTISTGRLHAEVESSNSAFAAACSLLIVLILAALGAQVYRSLGARTFEAEELRHLTGQVVTDPEASGGKAAYASKGMEKNALVYGPYEFFRPGEYEVLFSMKTGTASPGAEVAAIDVYGTASGVLAMQSLMSDDFDEPERYQEFRLFFSNPASQALQFRVWCKGTADLWVDKIIVQRGGTGRH